MQGTSSRDRAGEARARIELEARRNPDWRPWLRVLGLVIAEIEGGAWDAIAIDAAGRNSAAPLLDGAVIHLDGSLAAGWLRRLLSVAAEQGAAAGGLAALRRDLADPVKLLESAVRRDSAALEALAAEARVDAGALATVVELAARPVLHACRRRLAPRPPAGWDRGCCPICGGWPVLAELRGLERARHLRCSRCGGDWQFTVLRCPFCDERRHDRLALLLPEDERPVRHVEACRSCNGYVKTLVTLAATPPVLLPLEDLETVALDLVAQERGLRRPDRGRPLDVRLARTSSRFAKIRERLA